MHVPLELLYYLIGTSTYTLNNAHHSHSGEEDKGGLCDYSVLVYCLLITITTKKRLLVVVVSGEW